MIQYWTSFDTENFPIQYRYLVYWYLSLLFLPVFHQLFPVCCLPEVRDVPHWPYVIRHLNGHHQKLVPISTILTCVPSAFPCLLSSRGQGCPPLTVRDPPPQWPSPETGTYLYYSYLCSISFSLFAVFQRSGMSPTDRTWSATSMAITRNLYLSLLFLPVFHQLFPVCCLPEVRDVPHWPYVIRHLNGHHQKLVPISTILTCVPSAFPCLLSSRGQGCPPLTVRDPPPQWPSPETCTYLYYSYLCSISFSLFAVFQRSGMSPTDRTWSATSMAITRNLYLSLLFLPMFHQLFSVCCLPEVRDVPHWPYVIRHLNGHHQKLVPISTILTCVPSAFLCLLSSRGRGCPPLTVRDPPPQWPSPETCTYLYYSYLCSISFSLFAVFQRSGMSPTDCTWSATSMAITRNWYLSLLFLPVFHQLFSVCCLPEVRDVPHWPYVIRHLNGHPQKLVPVPTILTCVPSAFLCLLSSRGPGCPPLTVRDPPPQWPSPETGTYLYYSYLCSISFSLFAVFQRSGMSPTDRTWSATSMAITRNLYLSLLFLPVFHQLFSVCCLPEVRDVPHWLYVIRHLNGHHQKLVPISTILTCVPSAFLCLLSSRGPGCPPLTVRDPPPQWPSPETGTCPYYSYLCSISFSLLAVFQRSGMSPTDRTWSATSMAIPRNWYLSLLFLPVFHQLFSVCCLPEVRDVPHWPYVIRHLNGHHQKLVPISTILTCVPSAFLCLLSSRGPGCPPLTIRDPPPQWPSPETGTYLYYSYLCSISFSLFAVFQRSGMSPTDHTWSATSMAITRNWYLSLLFLPVFHQLFSVCCLPEVRDVPHWPYVIRHLNGHHQTLVPISTILTCVPSAFLCLLSSRGQGCPPLTVRDPPPQWPSPETGTYLYYSYLCSISFSLFAVFQRSGMSPTDRTWSATSMAITRNLSLLRKSAWPTETKNNRSGEKTYLWFKILGYLYREGNIF